jgi:hypothetical protein
MKIIKYELVQQLVQNFLSITEKQLCAVLDQGLGDVDHADKNVLREDIAEDSVATFFDRLSQLQNACQLGVAPENIVP